MTFPLPPLRECEVQLVYTSDDIRDDDLVTYYTSLLTPEERFRHDRLHFAQLQRRYLITRALVRWVLSRHTGATPESFVFAANAWGKPEIAQPEGAALAFNAANTQGIVACAVALADAVGVDVEDTSRTDQTFEIAQRYFSKAEVDALRAQPVGHRHDRFFDYWTLKEAYVKGRGMGMSLPFDKFTINLSCVCNPTVAAEPEIDDHARWQLGLVSLETGHRLACAVRRPGVGDTFDLRVHKVIPFAVAGSQPIGPTTTIRHRSNGPG